MLQIVAALCRYPPPPGFLRLHMVCMYIYMHSALSDFMVNDRRNRSVSVYGTRFDFKQQQRLEGFEMTSTCVDR